MTGSGLSKGNPQVRPILGDSEKASGGPQRLNIRNGQVESLLFSDLAIGGAVARLSVVEDSGDGMLGLHRTRPEQQIMTRDTISSGLFRQFFGDRSVNTSRTVFAIFEGSVAASSLFIMPVDFSGLLKRLSQVR